MSEKMETPEEKLARLLAEQAEDAAELAARGGNVPSTPANPPSAGGVPDYEPVYDDDPAPAPLAPSRAPANPTTPTPAAPVSPAVPAPRPPVPPTTPAPTRPTPSPSSPRVKMPGWVDTVLTEGQKAAATARRKLGEMGTDASTMASGAAEKIRNLRFGKERTPAEIADEERRERDWKENLGRRMESIRTDTGLSAEEKRAHALHVFLSAKERRQIETAKFKGMTEFLLKLDMFWNETMESSKMARAGKLALTTAMLSGTMFGFAALGGVSLTPSGVGAKMLTRVGAAVGLNSIMTWNIFKESNLLNKGINPPALAKVVNLRNALMAASVTGMFLSGGALLALVGAGGIALKVASNFAFDKGIKKREDLLASFDIKRFTESGTLDGAVKDYERTVKSLDRLRSFRNVANGAITIAGGIAALHVLDLQAAHAQENTSNDTQENAASKSSTTSLVEESTTASDSTETEDNAVGETITPTTTQTSGLEGHEITGNFKITLGEHGVPQNPETVFQAISANHMTVPAEGVTGEFAAKTLNMGANLTALSEGHGVAGITQEEWATAAHLENGELEIKNHEEFNRILDRLEENARQKWEDGTMQGEGAALSEASNISKEGWLKILHADGLDSRIPGTFTETGITGHDSITAEQIQDFGSTNAVEEQATQETVIVEPATETAGEDVAPSSARAEEHAAAVAEARVRVLMGYPDHPSDQDHFAPAQDTTHQEAVRETVEITKENPFGLPEATLRQVEEISTRNIAHIFPNDTEEVWNNLIKDGQANITIAIDNPEPGLLPFVNYLNKLQEYADGMIPRPEIELVGPAETNEEYIRRALQYIAAKHPEKLEELKNYN